MAFALLAAVVVGFGTQAISFASVRPTPVAVVTLDQQPETLAEPVLLVLFGVGLVGLSTRVRRKSGRGE